MINPTNFLDLYDVWFNELIGDVWLGIFITMITLLIICIKYKLRYEIILLFEVLLIGVIFEKTRIMALWVFIVLIIGALFYYTVSRIYRRG